MFCLHLTVFLLVHFAHCDENITIQYYKQLIQVGSVRALSYNLSQRNVEFEKGAASDKLHDYPKKFDVVIIGAGTAGAVVATRLSENPKLRIAVIEAGGEESDFSKIPNMAFNLQFSDMNWGYYSTPQKNCCLGMNNQQCMVPSGKVLGGNSAIDFGIYRRSSRVRYNEWAVKGWTYFDDLYYYKKSENEQIRGDYLYHKKGGVLNVEYGKPDSPLQPLVLKANEELHVPNIDYNGIRSVGVGKPQLNIKHGQKQSTNTAFLDYARSRDNVEVLTHAFATKIIINESNKTAQGVVFVKNDKKYKIVATKEVIVSAGTINSAQLLMLSGIGPRDHLKEHKIKVLQDLPVGKTLKDKTFLPIIVRTNTSLHNQGDLDTVVKQYLRGYGPLVKPLYTDLLEFIHADGTPEDAPTFQILMVPPPRTQAALLPRVFNYNQTVTQTFLKSINTETDFALDVINLCSKSSGSVKLKSSNPIDHPKIDLNYFSDPRDVEVFLKAVKFVNEQLVKTKAFREIGASLQTTGLCTNYEKGSDERNECVIRALATSAYEFTGTTAMGEDPKTSVVDKNAQVHGMMGLRVVDAGIFSKCVSGRADTIMAAEKISDIIKQKYSDLH
ncbi:hypothetical protein Zmor_019674 [Zophobas morio]|uniref:Uncharacterized protein n=1 Tax=Zophobas morio TaxID=2755281 RepID=A0AA38I403_9CUCU|nr:hypothetical protein Zmor_019674 [Zophobas morio]